MPQGTIVVGHKHKTEHLNIVTSGRCMVAMDGKVLELKAGDIVRSKAGCQKALYIYEDTKWITIHPTEERDLDRLEELHIEKSDQYLQFHEELKAIETHLEQSMQEIQ